MGNSEANSNNSNNSNDDEKKSSGSSGRGSDSGSRRRRKKNRQPPSSRRKNLPSGSSSFRGSSDAHGVGGTGQFVRKQHSGLMGDRSTSSQGNLNLNRNVE